MTGRIRRLKAGEAVPSMPPRRYKTKPGYIILRWKVARGRYVEVLEHRVIDGVVTTAEQVHHKNRQRDDNRPENLEHLTAEEHWREHESELAEEALWMYEAGATTTAIAERFRRDPSAVYRLLARRGVSFRPRNAHLPPIDPELIRQWHAEGVRIDSMLRRLGAGYGRGRIEATLEALGLPKFKPGNPNRVRSPHYRQAGAA